MMTNCGPSTALIEMVVENTLCHAIESGRVQGGLLQCDDSQLHGKSNVVQCSEFENMLCEALTKRPDCQIRNDSLTFDAATSILSLTDTAGNELTVDLSALLDNTDTVIVSGVLTAGNQLQLTDNNGKTVEIDMSALAKDTYIQSLTLDGTVLKAARTDDTNLEVDLASLLDNTDTFVTSALVDVDGFLVLTRNDGEQVKVDLKTLLSKDTFVVEGELKDGYLHLYRNDKGEIIIDLSELQKDDVFVTTGELDGNVLKLTKNDGTVVEVDLSDLQTTDTKVESGELNAAGNLVLTMNDGTQVTVDFSSLQVDIDVCGEIGKFVERDNFVPGDYLVVRNAGGCALVRVPDRGMFTDAKVHMTAQRTSVLEGDMTNLIVTVSNVGPGTVGNLRMMLTSPPVGDPATYEIERATVAKPGSVTVDPISGEPGFIIKELARGNVVTFTYPLKFMVRGAYSFAADIAIQDANAIDFDENDDHASISYVVESAKPVEPEPEDCPFAVVNIGAEGGRAVRIKAARTINNGEQQAGISYPGEDLFGFLVEGREFSFHIENAELFQIGSSENASEGGVPSHVAVGGKVYRSWAPSGPLNFLYKVGDSWIPRRALPGLTASWDPASRILSCKIETTEDDPAVATSLRKMAAYAHGIFIRKSANCKWQYFPMVFKGEEVEESSVYTVTGLPASTQTRTTTPSMPPLSTGISYEGNDFAYGRDLRPVETLTLTLPSKHAQSFTINATGLNEFVINKNVVGLVSVTVISKTEARVVVDKAVTSAESFTYDRIHFIFDDSAPEPTPPKLTRVLAPASVEWNTTSDTEVGVQLSVEWSEPSNTEANQAIWAKLQWGLGISGTGTGKTPTIVVEPDFPGPDGKVNAVLHLPWRPGLAAGPYNGMISAVYQDDEGSTNSPSASVQFNASGDPANGFLTYEMDTTGTSMFRVASSTSWWPANGEISIDGQTFQPLKNDANGVTDLSQYKGFSKSATANVRIRSARQACWCPGLKAVKHIPDNSDIRLTFEGVSAPFSVSQLPRDLRFLTNCFRDSTVFTIGGIDRWDTSNIVDFSGCFQDCATFDGDVGGWDISKGTAFNWMFSGCTQFNGNLGRWKPTAMTSATRMFNNCLSFTNLSAAVRNWSPHNLSSASYMFAGVGATALDFNGWSMSKLNDCSYMFANNLAKSLRVELSEWDMTKVRNAQGMFKDRQVDMDVTKWKLPELTNMAEMFSGCTGFNQDISGWVLGKVTTVKAAFEKLDFFDQDLGVLAGNPITDASMLFRNSRMATGKGMESWTADGIKTVLGMAQNANRFDPDLSGWCTKPGINTAQVDEGASGWAPEHKPAWGTCV